MCVCVSHVLCEGETIANGHFAKQQTLAGSSASGDREAKPPGRPSPAKLLSVHDPSTWETGFGVALLIPDFVE